MHEDNIIHVPLLAKDIFKNLIFVQNVSRSFLSKEIHLDTIGGVISLTPIVFSLTLLSQIIFYVYKILLPDSLLTKAHFY